MCVFVFVTVAFLLSLVQLVCHQYASALGFVVRLDTKVVVFCFVCVCVCVCVSVCLSVAFLVFLVQLVDFCLAVISMQVLRALL